ncbi:hypothetical protein ABOM_006399 [Aspergillus bombycis]|uniref:Major facilitator superfamily (MFS) profile domain-containing protein n=1 Tax=Aspergillus bombycis TaxID=109264 RepID=A0A1F8A0N5_9EURO|nr:hypothetical protein ABOM_006399 [Aspergillus bombycis]OGM45292.1 hypothetical protein ABOM_006399 [Aspergillus bombycis]
MAVNEETPLLRSRRQDRKKTKADGVYDKLVLYGVSFAAADESIILSTWSVIASEFHHLSQGSWLLAAYNFGWCVSLPVVSPTSRSKKGVRLTFSRHIHGLAGVGPGAHWNMVPADEVALLRSYANVFNVVGRSVGAPLGGYLIGAVRWRWPFIGQLPVAAICLLIGLYRFPSSLNSTKTGAADEGNSQHSIMGLDLAGLVSFSVTVLLLFLMQELSAPSDGFQIPLTILASAVCVAVILFIVIEAYWARTPLIPLQLMKTSLGGLCLNQILMMSSRSGQSRNIIGPAANVAIVQRVFMGKLENNLNEWNEKKFIGQILNDDRFAQCLSPAVQEIVRWNYLNAFQLVPYEYDTIDESIQS